MYVINEKLNDNLTDQDMFCFMAGIISLKKWKV